MLTNLLSENNLYQYQKKAIKFVMSHKKNILFLDMGLGKTVITLTAIKQLLEEESIKRFLIIAPLRICNTVWKQETKKWEHLHNLDIGICTGDGNHREHILKNRHQVTVINKENIAWLQQIQKKFEWEGLVVDESSSFKNPRTLRFKALKPSIKKLKRVILLTGTPAPNGLIDLWSQIYIADEGVRLEKNFGKYKKKYFHKSGYLGYELKPKKNAFEIVENKIKDITLRMDCKDYIQLPNKIMLDEVIHLSIPLIDKYEVLERDFFLRLSQEVKILTFNAAALANKLLQFCNGAIYDENKGIHLVHDLKLRALKDLIEDNPSETFLVAYHYRSDLQRLKKVFPEARILSKDGSEIDDWNEGNIKILLAHPMSAGHGLNLQEGGSIIVWFGLTWSLELYEQFNARLYRQGQKKPVRIIHLIIKNTMDEKVLRALKRKERMQNIILNDLNKGVYNDIIKK